AVYDRLAIEAFTGRSTARVRPLHPSPVVNVHDIDGSVAAGTRPLPGIELAVVGREGAEKLLRSIEASTTWSTSRVPRLNPGGAVKDQDIAGAVGTRLPGIELAVVDGESGDPLKRPVEAREAH